MAERFEQADFLQICPEGSLRLPYIRSLESVFQRDFLATLDCMRKLYIPNYQSEELIGFSTAFNWAKENLEQFVNAGFRGSGLGFSSLPKIVQEHRACLGFLFIFLEEMMEYPPEQIVLPVAHMPGLPIWQEDIRVQTEPDFLRLKNFPKEEKSFDPEYDSITRCLSLIATGFASEWKESRAEASDELASQLFLPYWLTLKKRLREQAELGDPDGI